MFIDYMIVDDWLVSNDYTDCTCLSSGTYTGGAWTRPVRGPVSPRIFRRCYVLEVSAFLLQRGPGALCAHRRRVRAVGGRRGGGFGRGPPGWRPKFSTKNVFTRTDISAIYQHFKSPVSTIYQHTISSRQIVPTQDIVVQYMVDRKFFPT